MSLVLAGHFENSDTITDGSPAGYNSNADQTWARAGTKIEYSSTQKSDGSYSIHTVSTTWSGKYADITADLSANAGTFIFDIYVVTGVANGFILGATADSSNKILVYFSGGATNVGVSYTGGGSSKNVATSSGELTANTWHTVTVKWSRTAVGGKYVSIKVDAGTVYTIDTALDTFTGSPTALRIGNDDWSELEMYIDNLKAYDEWYTPAAGGGSNAVPEYYQNVILKRGRQWAY